MSEQCDQYPIGNGNNVPHSYVVFQPELELFVFFLCLYSLELFVEAKAGISPLLADIVVGTCLGPPLADIIPFADAFRLLGKLGILLLVLESGLTVNIESVREVGQRAFAAAAFGVIGPVALAMLFLMTIWGDSWKSSLSAGASIAPTSMGFAAKLLNECGQISSPSGQLIVTAAVVDDVLSLMLLSIVQALDDDDVQVWSIIRPVLASFGSIFMGVFLTWALPPCIRACLSAIKGEELRDRVSLISLLVLAALMAWGSALLGSSDLLGCFFAGLIFSTTPSVKSAYELYFSPFVRWGASLFFAATIAFGFPPLTEDEGLFDGEAAVRGTVLSVAAILGKFLCVLFVQPFTLIEVMKFGWAMNGRGEFSFLIADQGARDGILSTTLYGGVVWALLVACFSSPFGFRYWLNRSPEQVSSGASESLSPNYYRQDREEQANLPVLDSTRPTASSEKAVNAFDSQIHNDGDLERATEGRG